MSTTTKKTGTDNTTPVESRSCMGGVTRRTFIKTTGALAATAGAAGIFFRAGPASAAGVPAMDRSGVPDPVETDTTKVDVKYSVCLQCHSACGIKVKVSKGATPTLLSIRGNPFHPCAADDDVRLTQGAVPINDPTVLKAAGTICPKGNAGVEIIYNPYRILQPLKRVGARGSGRWQTITYAQAIKEIAAKIAPYWTRGPDPSYTPTNADYIDPANKSLGFKNNQVALYIGRLEHGQKEFSDRWMKYGFGSVNARLDHTSTCETSHHVALDHVFAKKKHHTKPDFPQAKFVLIIGANALEAGFPQQALSRKIARAIKDNGLKLAVADPRFSKVAGKAVATGGYWLPVMPATDAAMCFAIMRHWLDGSPSIETDSGNRIDTKYLRNATKGQADAAGELSVSDATYLIRRDDGKYYKDAGGNFMVWDGTAGVAVGTAPHSNAATPTKGKMLASGVTVGGVVCDSVFQLLSNEIKKNSVAGWAGMAGLDAALVGKVATDLAAAGKQGSVEFYRGPVQVTNGMGAGFACAALNTLRGNYDVKGGCAVTGGGHWHEMDGKGKTGSLPIGKPVSGAYSATGPRMDRAKASWATYKGSETKPKRPWFPLANYGVWQEVIPSIGARYPYPIKALFSYWADPIYTTPAGGAAGVAVLKDEVALPLFVAMDNDFGAMASLADYIIPDTTYLERWSTPHTAPVLLSTVSGFRQPMVGAYKTPATPKFDEWQSAVGNTWQYEDFWIAMAKELETVKGRAFPGIGTDGLATGRNLDSAWDWYDAILDNFAAESGVSKTSIQEHGGIFEAPGNEYSGNTLTHHFKSAEVIRLYSERMATTADHFVDPTGATKFFPLPRHDVVRDVMDNPVQDDPVLYPYIGVTYKPIQHKQGVTEVCATLMMLQPTNYIEMNPSDARSEGLETGDTIRLSSISRPAGVVGQVLATEGVRPGVIAVSMSFGRLEMSSRPHEIDGKLTGFDARRGKGVNTNPIMRLDPVLGDVGLQDKIGGSVAYSNTRFRVTKVNA